MSRESVSINDAADLVGVSRWTISRLVKSGKLVAFRVGGCKRIHLSELRRLKRENIIKNDGAGRSSV